MLCISTRKPKKDKPQAMPVTFRFGHYVIEFHAALFSIIHFYHSIISSARVVWLQEKLILSNLISNFCLSTDSFRSFCMILNSQFKHLIYSYEDARRQGMLCYNASQEVLN